MAKQYIQITILAIVLTVVYSVFAAQSGFSVFSQSAVISMPEAKSYTGGLMDYYACTRGHVQSACAALYNHSTPQTTDYTGGLMDYYACTRGNVKSACDALYNETVSQNRTYTGGLMDYYACTRGHVQSACAALHEEAHSA